MSPTNPIERYLLRSWTQTCGVGWTSRQITFAHATSIALTVAVLFAAYANGLDWSWAQFIVAAQKWVIGIEVAISLGLVCMSFVVADVTASFQVFGVTVYGGLVIATAVLIRAPVNFQRTTAVIALVSMTVVGLFLSPPAGFEWLVPVYFLKLLVGSTAKE